MYSRLKISAFFLLTALVLLLSISVASFADEKKDPEDKVATVNGAPILKKDFDREINLAKKRLTKRGAVLKDKQLSKLKDGVLKNLINTELLYQESQKRGILIDDASVNQRLSDLKKRYSDEEEFKKAMSSRMGLSTESDIKSQIQHELAINKFIDKKFDEKIKISEKEVRDYYDSHPEYFKQPEKVKASHILIKVSPKADESKKKDALEKIKKIQKRLQKGEDFGALAKESSECPSSKRGGDLGFFKRGQMAKPFEDAAFTTKPGEITDIVKTRFGYHLIKVVEKKPETTIKFESIKDRIEQRLKQEKLRKEITAYLEELNKTAKVKKFLPAGKK